MTMPRLAIFGDSSYAAVRQAHVRDPDATAGWEVEYWGHVGRRFRFLEYRDGAIVATDDYTAARFAKFNERGRRSLPVADFDAIWFVGCRIDLILPFWIILHHLAQGGTMTRGLTRRILSDRLDASPSWGFARRFARDGQARILVSPPSFLIEGDLRGPAALYPAARNATAAQRAALWAEVTAVMDAAGVTLLPQPDHTVTDGIFTKRDFAVDGFTPGGDHYHKNPTYGALILAQAMAALGQGEETT